MYKYVVLMSKLSFSYIIFDLVSDSHYMMSVNISVCYEPDNCTLTENIVQNTMFPKPVCDFKSTDFVIPSKLLQIYTISDHYNP